MLTQEGNSIVFTAERCCQCGVCLAACDYGALLKSQDRNGLLQINWDPDKCSFCLKCIKVCPVRSLEGDDESVENAVGRALAIYLGHARDHNIRWQASSGGVARTLLKYALDSGTVDAVYTLAYPQRNDVQAGLACAPDGKPSEMVRQVAVQPTGAEATGQWFSGLSSLCRIPCSLYRPILWGERMGEISPTWVRVLLVGLPCQIRAAKSLLACIAPQLQTITIAILCHQQKTLGYTSFMQGALRCRDVPKAWVTYRGRGWPGTGGCFRKVARFKDFGFAFNAWLPLWRIPGCISCANNLSATDADITLGDPWGLLNEDVDPIGTNLVIVWTLRGNTLLQTATSEVRLVPATMGDALTSIPPDVMAGKKRQYRMMVAGGRPWRAFCRKLAIHETLYCLFPRTARVVLPRVIAIRWKMIGAVDLVRRFALRVLKGKVPRKQEA